MIIGGLISATLLTLIVLPTLYLMFEDRKAHPTTAPDGDDERKTLGEIASSV